MRINHNIAALNTYRQLTGNVNSTSRSLEKLSSGLRVNKAGDDAAGLAISEKMRAQIRGLDQATRNANDAISLIQTAEGALTETHSILQRMRELAVQSATDTNTDLDRGEIQKEIDNLLDEVDRIANETQFNGQSLLNGGFKGNFHLGANADQGLKTEISKMDAGELKVENLRIVEVKSSNDMEVPGDTQTTNLAEVHLFDGDAGNKLENIGAKAISVSNDQSVYDGDYLLEVEDLGGDEFKLTLSRADRGSSWDIDPDTSYSITMSKQDIIDADGKVELRVDPNHNPDDKLIVDFNDITAGELKLVFTNYVEPSSTDNPITNAVTEDVAGVAVTIQGADDNPAYENVTVIIEHSETVRTVWSGNEADGYTLTIGLATAEGESAYSAEDINGWIEFSLGVAEEGTFPPFADFKLTASFDGKIEVPDDPKDFEAVIFAFGSGSGGNQNLAGIAIDKIDAAIQKVSSERAKLGGIQNRLEHTINNLGTTSENLSASESRIRDVDMAKEMMEFTKNSILSQASQAMLAQANMQPQSVLQLLQ